MTKNSLRHSDGICKKHSYCTLFAKLTPKTLFPMIYILFHLIYNDRNNQLLKQKSIYYVTSYFPRFHPAKSRFHINISITLKN